jgi:hypothetical protein
MPGSSDVELSEHEDIFGQFGLSKQLRMKANKADDRITSKKASK